MSDNKRIETLLEQFIKDGTTSIREIREKVTALQVEMSTFREKIENLSRSIRSEKGDRKAKDEELRKELEASKKRVNKIRQHAEKTINEFEKKVIGLDLDSNAEELKEIKDEIVEIEQRLADIEQRLNRWIGALSVIVTLLVGLLGAIERWAGGILPFIF